MQTCIMSSLPRCIFRCSVFRYVTLVSFFSLFLFKLCYLIVTLLLWWRINTYLLTYITTKLYDKRDAFGFHIVNFPFMSSNIPSAPAYGVYASQLVRYARCCSSYSDFLIRHRALVKRLLSQGYKVNHLSNTFKKFYGRHTDLVGQYKKNVCQMFADSIS